MLDGETVGFGALAFALVFRKDIFRPGGVVVVPLGGYVPGGRPSPDVVVILGRVARDGSVDRLLDGFGACCRLQHDSARPELVSG